MPRATTEELARRVLASPLQQSGDFADLGVTVTTALALLVLAIVAVTTVLGERRLGQTVASSLGFLGLCVLPIFMMLFGAFTTVERSKSVEFCHSCHRAMTPYVTDMQDPRSTTLAAVHFTQRWIPEHECYRCHADYGVWGSADAKLRGFSHLYHWLLGSPTAEGEEQIRTYRPYRNEICLSCHAGGLGFVESGQGVHLMIASNLVERNPTTGADITSCLVCHGPAHPTLAEWKLKSKDRTATDAAPAR
jgi:nitrate/TMAO reductase-like tetraheme cytochrome c subunit